MNQYEIESELKFKNMRANFWESYRWIPTKAEVMRFAEYRSVRI